MAPLYVGLQSYCVQQGGLALMSADWNTASYQGAVSANDAVGRANSLGLGPGTPIYFDMEAYNNGDGPCVEVTRAFVTSWTNQLHALGYISAYYSSAASGVADEAAVIAWGGPNVHYPMDAAQWAKALAKLLEADRKAHLPQPVFAHVFPFSTHHYELRMWLASAGIDPDVDVRLCVVPPPRMVGELAAGRVDGFCVGAPWNSVAIKQGVGRILHFGCDIQARLVEKVRGATINPALPNSLALKIVLVSLEGSCVVVTPKPLPEAVCARTTVSRVAGSMSSFMRRRPVIASFA